MKRKHKLIKIFAAVLCLSMVFHMFAAPMLTYAATPSNFLYWHQLTPNAVSLSGGNGYYQITDMQTLGTNASVNSWGSDGVSEGTYWTFNPMHVATSSRVAYQRLFSVNYGTTISLAAGKDGGENTTNTENIAWSVEEWDANGNFLWDSGWLYTNQSYTVGSSTSGSNLGISQSNLGSRSNVKYITLIFRRIADDGLVDNGGNVAITPSELATLFPNLYVCYSTFGYSVKNSSGTQIGWINRRGTESTTLKSYQPADIDGYTFSWKIDSSSSITPNWMNGNVYPATQVESWLSSGKFYNSLFGNVSFTACYVPNTYYIQYLPNGGSGDKITDFYYYNSTYNIRESSTFSKEGYTLSGWNTKADGSEAYHAPRGTGTYVWPYSFLLYAQWTPNIYKVTLDNQSATSAGTTEYYEKYDSGNYKEVGCATSVSSITIPTKTGYTFGGYYTGKDGTGTQYIDTSGNIKSTKTSFTADTTLYAKWTVNSYTISYDANGGTGAPESQNYTYASSGTTALSTMKPTRTGYTFLGWNTSSTATSATYVAGAAFNKSVADDTILYAVWAKSTYTVSYDANGGTTSAGTKTYAYGTGVDLSPSATKDGYTFVGWSTSSTARMPLTSLTMPASNVTLYAVYTREVSDVENHDYPSYAATESISNDEVYLLVWIKENSSVYRYYPLTYKYDTNTMVYKYELPATDISSFASGREFCYQLIAFDNAGNYTILKDGSGGTTPPLPPAEYLQTVKHYKQDANTGEWIWFDTTTSMVESGETFTPAYVTAPIGYSSSSKDTGGTVTAAKTYNAYYKPNTYTITFHANGGSCSPATKSVLYSSYYGELPVPTRTGYTFLGWNTVSDGTGTTISSGDIYDTVGDETLYAQWRANVYTVTLDAQKATTPGTADYYQKYDTGNYTSSDCTTAITSITTPTKTGYTFGGYYTGKEGTGTQYVNALGVITSTNTTFTTDTTLYAYWVANTYSIQYNANGGNGTMANTIAVYDTCVMLSANTFERTGYTFEGWSTTADGAKVYEDKDSVKNLTTENGDIINLYAVWKLNSYNVIYDYWTNGGTSVTVDTDMVSYDSPIDLTVVAEKGEGYTFVGWNTIPEATTGLDSLSMGTEHVTLYAIFEKTITVTLIENSDSGTITTSISDTIYNNERFANFRIEEKGHWNGWKNIGWTDKSSATEDAIISTGAIYSTDNSSTLYARYESSVTVSYDANGSTVNYDSQTKECYYNASGTAFYPTFTIAKAPVFSSYSFDKWVAEDGTEYAADTEAVMEKDTILTARWDKYPELSVSNRYFTLEQAQDGKITPLELLKKVVARDREDGILANGTDVIVKDYNASIFTNMTKDSEVEITYQATDSFGNEVTKRVIVAIADTSMKKSMKQTYVRFISRDFFADDAGNMISVDKGGLEETSIWKLNPAYRSLLQSTLFYEKTDVESYFFTSQDIEWVKEYTNTYGHVQNAVEEFLEFLLAKSSILSY